MGSSFQSSGVIIEKARYPFAESRSEEKKIERRTWSKKARCWESVIVKYNISDRKGFKLLELYLLSKDYRKLNLYE